MQVRAVVVALLVSLLVPLSDCCAAEPAPATEAERQALFAWFDKLDYVAVRGTPLVRYASGETWSYSGKPLRNSYRHGFLLHDTGEMFLVVTPDLRTLCLRKTPKGTPEFERIGYEPADLVKYTAQAVKESREDRSDFKNMHSTISEAGGLFVLAWACDRQGHKAAAAEAFTQVEAASKTSPQPGTSWSGATTARERVMADIATADMWLTTKRLGNPDISREESLARHRWFLTAFSGSVHAPRVEAAAKVLEQMIVEDRAHAERRRTGKPLEQLPVDEQVAEWIFQLRNQNRDQFTQGPRIEILIRWDGDETTPADRLVELGYDAVPQLIAALDDRQLTRSIDYEIDFQFTHKVLTVGDCAEMILSRIAGRSLYQPPLEKSFGKLEPKWHALMSESDAATKVRADAEAWYAEYLQRGEKAMVLSAVAKGDPSCLTCAKRLVDKYPNEALPALMSAARATDDLYVRFRLLEQILRLPNDVTDAALLAEVRQGPSTEFRLAAAEALILRGRREGVVEAVLKTWREKSLGLGWHSLFEAKHAPGAIAEFLASCQSVQALDGLSVGLSRRCVELRMEAVFAAGGSFIPRNFMYDENRTIDGGDDETSLRAATIRFLAASLDDHEAQENLSTNFGEVDVNGPRVCDVAAWRLHELDPKRFAFNFGAPLRERNRQCAVLRNIARQDQGLPPLSIPTDPQPAALRAEVVGPAIDRALRGGRDYAAALKALEKLGPGALPVLVERIAQLPEGSESREGLEVVAYRLASTVIAVEFTERSLKPSPAVMSKLSKLKNKPFDPEKLADILLELTGSLTNEAPAILLVAEREAGEGGTRLRFDLFDRRRAEPYIPPNDENRRSLMAVAEPVSSEGAAPVVRVAAQTEVGVRRNRPTNWSYTYGATDGDGLVPGAIGGGGYDAPNIRRDDLIGVLQSGTSAPPDDSISIMFRVAGYVEPEPDVVEAEQRTEVRPQMLAKPQQRVGPLKRLAQRIAARIR